MNLQEAQNLYNKAIEGLIAARQGQKQLEELGFVFNNSAIEEAIDQLKEEVNKGVDEMKQAESLMEKPQQPKEGYNALIDGTRDEKVRIIEEGLKELKNETIGRLNKLEVAIRHGVERLRNLEKK